MAMQSTLPMSQLTMEMLSSMMLQPMPPPPPNGMLPNGDRISFDQIVAESLIRSEHKMVDITRRVTAMTSESEASQKKIAALISELTKGVQEVQSSMTSHQCDNNKEGDVPIDPVDDFIDGLTAQFSDSHHHSSTASDLKTLLEN